jgi:hypothetical protein
MSCEALRGGVHQLFVFLDVSSRGIFVLSCSIVVKVWCGVVGFFFFIVFSPNKEGVQIFMWICCTLCGVEIVVLFKLSSFCQNGSLCMV